MVFRSCVCWQYHLPWFCNGDWIGLLEVPCCDYCDEDEVTLRAEWVPHALFNVVNGQNGPSFMLQGLYSRVPAIFEARNSFCGCLGNVNNSKKSLKCDIVRPEINRVAIAHGVGQRPFEWGTTMGSASTAQASQKQFKMNSKEDIMIICDLHYFKVE